MKKNLYFFGILFFATAFAFTACDGGSSGADSGNGTTDIPIIFSGMIQSGETSGTVDSTSLILTFDVDPVTLTADNITVTGATKGVLSGNGNTRNLSILDITAANGSTVTITIASPAGYSIIGASQNATVYRTIASNLVIGMNYRGGKLAYILQAGDPGYDASVPHGLIASIADQNAGIVWISGGSTQTTAVPGGTEKALGTGSANTSKIVDQAISAGNNDLTSYGIGLTHAYDNDGYTDWYTPSYDELYKLYINRGSIGGFGATVYLSSSEDHAAYYWTYNFADGGHGSVAKNNVVGKVRAIRSF
ncbi:MAG: hypothetical protein JW982_04630 [Spirochaetes bacterium]|nr:hypothetical protein [Spirochaetota bacterium]